MSQIILERYCYSETETEGRLYLPEHDDYIYTLERPWIAGPAGGLPFESCVPDGEYQLVPYTRSKGRGDVYALRNPALGVYFTKQERGNRQGRYKILIHSANWVEQVVGCIAPGLARTIAENKRMVRASRDALTLIMARRRTSIIIRPALGTET